MDQQILILLVLRKSRPKVNFKHCHLGLSPSVRIQQCTQGMYCSVQPLQRANISKFNILDLRWCFSKPMEVCGFQSRLTKGYCRVDEEKSEFLHAA